jgi:hypothetical protein
MLVRLAVLAAAAGVALPAPARAAHTWSGPLLTNTATSNEGAFTGFACPSEHQCTAIDNIGQELTFDPATPGDPVPFELTGDEGGDETGPLHGIVCPSVHQCTATINSGTMVTFDPAAPADPAPVEVSASVQGPNCPTVTLCVSPAGAQATSVVAFNPQALAPATLHTISAGFPITGLDCPTATQCTIIDGNGGARTFDPGAPGSPARVVVDDAVGFYIYTALSCPSATQCTAIANQGNVARQVSFNPQALAVNTATTIDAANTAPGLGYLPYGALVCRSTTRCTAMAYKRLVTFDPTAPGTPMPVSGAFDGIDFACASPAVCVTAGAVAGSATAFDPTASSLSAGVTVASAHDLRAVGCASITQCAAVDINGWAVAFNPTDAGGAPAAIYLAAAQEEDTAAQNAVACPTVTECTALGRFQEHNDFNPQTSAVTSGFLSSGPSGFHDVACPLATQCTAVADEFSQSTELTFDPSAHTASAGVKIDTEGGARGVSCPTASQCTAVGLDGRAVTFDPGAPGTPTPVAVDTGHLTDVACPTAAQCTAVDTDGNELTFNPAAPGAPAAHVLSTSPLTAIACPAVDDCVAVDRAGRAVEGDPADPASFAVTPITGASLLRGIACAATAVCVAVDRHGSVFVGSDGSVPVPTPSPSPAPSSTPTAVPTTSPPAHVGATAAAALACSGAQIKLVFTDTVGRTVHVHGAAVAALIGKPVTVTYVKTKQVVGTATVAADGLFTATVPLPPKRIRADGDSRYVATAGGQTSTSLKLTRRENFTLLATSSGKVRAAGRVTGRFPRAAKVTLTQRVSCTQSKTVARTKLDAHGRWEATFPAPTPAIAAVAVYRARTTVFDGKRKIVTFTLPQPAA